MNSDDYRERLECYTRERKLTVLTPLGAGTQGSVFLIANLSQARRTAVKFHHREVWQDWREMKSDAFEDNWPAVEGILGEFQSYGIYIADVNTSNIRF